MRKELCLIAFLALASALIAQPAIFTGDEVIPEQWCGYERTTENDAQFDEFIRWFYIENNGHVNRDLEMLYMPMKVHLVGNTDGSSRIPISRMLDLLCKLNADFALSDSQIFFYLKDYNLINNTTWNNWVNPNGGSYAQILNNIFKDPLSLNSFLVGNAPTSSLCGVYMGTAVGAQVPGGMDVTFMANGCLGPNSSTWAHEMGHYLSLPHTFQGWGGNNTYQCGTSTTNSSWAEKVDGSNCHLVGDRICDTPPDYLSGRWTCNASSQSTCIQIDPNGVEFQSDGENYMSYSGDVCMVKFTPHQIEAMHFQINNYRAFMKKTEQQFIDEVWAGPITQAPNPISPANGEIIETFDYVTLTWEADPNATHYILQISPVTNFTVLTEDLVLTTNTFVSTILAPNRANYYWRVRAFNNGDFCGTYAAIGNFGTGEEVYVNTFEPNSGNGVTISPNPFRNSDFLRLDIDLAAYSIANITLRDIQGRTIYRESGIEMQSGSQQHVLNTPDLTAGIYLITFETQQGIINKKLIVQ